MIDTFPVVLIVTAVIIGLFGLVGNIMAFVGFQKQSKKTSTSFLFQALAVADSLVILANCLTQIVACLQIYILNLHLLANVYNGAKLSELLAWITFIVYPLSEMTILASISVTVLLAVTRLIAVYFPMRARRLCSIARVRCSVAAVVIFAIVYNLPLYVMKTVSTNTYRNRTFTYATFKKAKYYAWFMNYGRPVVYCAIPLLLITVITIALIIKLRSLDKRRAALTRAQRLSNKTTRVLIAVLVVFFVCSLPHPLCVLCLSSLFRCTFSHLRYFNWSIYFLYIVNSSVNFLIYTSLSRQYRAVISQVCCSCSRPAANRIEQRPRNRATPSNIIELKSKLINRKDKCALSNLACNVVDIEMSKTHNDTPVRDIGIHQECEETPVGIRNTYRKTHAADIQIHQPDIATHVDDIEINGTHNETPVKDIKIHQECREIPVVNIEQKPEHEESSTKRLYLK